MRLFVVALMCALTVGGAAAKDGDCMMAAGTGAPDFGLPRVAQAIARKKLDISVVGSASSELNGPAGTNIAYPTRLELALTSLLPGVAVKVSTFARPRETASEMENKLERIVADSKPALVIWQTGTADAIRGVDPDEFRVALDAGVDVLQSAKADVVFMNMQYSPRTEAMLAVGAYADAMRPHCRAASAERRVGAVRDQPISIIAETVETNTACSIELWRNGPPISRSGFTTASGGCSPMPESWSQAQN